MKNLLTILLLCAGLSAIAQVAPVRQPMRFTNVVEFDSTIVTPLISAATLATDASGNIIAGGAISSYWDTVGGGSLDIIATNNANIQVNGFYAHPNSLLDSYAGTGVDASTSAAMYGIFNTIPSGAANTGVNLGQYIGFGQEVYINNNSGTDKLIYANTAGDPLIAIATWGSNSSQVTILQGEVWVFKKISTVWLAYKLSN